MVFDDRTGREFIADLFDDCFLKAFELCEHPAMRSDYFRLCYLLSRGGVYVDADEVYCGNGISELMKDAKLKIQPLCYDLEAGSMVPIRQSLGHSSFLPHLIFYANNNPILSVADHPIVALALERATAVLLTRGVALGIQSTTGPGNFTASVVRHSLDLGEKGHESDFQFVLNWDEISQTRWALSYRADERNWRRWDRKRFQRADGH